jgi:Amt family ammonium transporter
MGAMAIGAGAGGLCYFAVRLRSKLGVDDSLDVVGVHGVGGVWGALATGLFAVSSVTGGAEGLFAGDAGQFLDQIIGVVATMGYSFVMTFAILKVLDVVMGLRVSEEDELIGLDASQHGERAYLLDGGSPYSGIPVMAEPVAYAPPAVTPTGAD